MSSERYTVLCEQANCLAHLQQITHMASAEGGGGLLAAGMGLSEQPDQEGDPEN
jgi:hypothetical protein